MGVGEGEGPLLAHEKRVKERGREVDVGAGADAGRGLALALGVGVVPDVVEVMSGEEGVMVVGAVGTAGVEGWTVAVAFVVVRREGAAGLADAPFAVSVVDGASGRATTVGLGMKSKPRVVAVVAGRSAGYRGQGRALRHVTHGI